MVGGGGGVEVGVSDHTNVCKIPRLADLYLCQIKKYQPPTWHVYQF